MESVGCHFTAAALGTQTGNLGKDVGLTGRRKESDVLFRILNHRLRCLELSTRCTGTGYDDDDLFYHFVGIGIALRKSKHWQRQQCGHRNQTGCGFVEMHGSPPVVTFTRHPRGT